MKLRSTLATAVLLAVSAAAATSWAISAKEDSSAPPPDSVKEARARSLLLYETLRGSLAIMHRDFFDEEAAGAIPSASMEDVFHELGATHDVRVKWLVVNTDMVNVDHEPEDEFERQAAKALARGADHYQKVEPASENGGNSRFRFVGSITLRSQCLKCHVKRRTSNEDRVAGLAISMPIGNSHQD